MEDRFHTVYGPSTSLADLQTFLGMVQFPSRFIPDLASMAANLWALTKKTSEFVWSREHQSALDRIKKAIMAPALLQYFDRTQPVTIQVDTSHRGLGALLPQSNGVCQQVVDRNRKSLLQHQKGNASCPLWLGEVPLLCLLPACCHGIRP